MYYVRKANAINSPASVLPKKDKTENGFQEVDEASLRRGEERHTKYFYLDNEQTSANPQVSFTVYTGKQFVNISQALAHYQ